MNTRGLLFAGLLLEGIARQKHNKQINPPQHAKRTDLSCTRTSHGSLVACHPTAAATAVLALRVRTEAADATKW